MNSTTNKPNWWIALGLPFLIYICCYIITISPKFVSNTDLLSSAILADLLIMSPVIYFLAIRSSNISKKTVIRIFMAGCLFAGLILNDSSNNFLHFIRIWISPVLELYAIYFIGIKFYAANKKSKAKGLEVDFLNHCRRVMFEWLGNQKLANIISSEISVFYYLIFATNKTTADNKIYFSNYKHNGVSIVLYAILVIFMIETVAMHFLFSMWNSTVAWVISILSFYTCLQLLGHIRALKSRPARLNEYSIELHNGLAADAEIYYHNIHSIELNKRNPVEKKYIRLSLLNNFEKHNIVLSLKSPVHIIKLFGISKKADTIVFYIDNPDDFIKEVSGRAGV